MTRPGQEPAAAVGGVCPECGGLGGFSVHASATPDGGGWRTCDVCRGSGRAPASEIDAGELPARLRAWAAVCPSPPQRDFLAASADRLAALEAENARLRAGEEAVRQVLIQMYAAAVAGMADAVLVADQEYGPGHVLAVVRQLADEAKCARARVADLEAALGPFAAYAAELDQARVPDLAPCAYFPGIGGGGHAPTARDHRRAAAAAAKEAGRG